jgi:hypothetical protein
MGIRTLLGAVGESDAPGRDPSYLHGYADTLSLQ